MATETKIWMAGWGGVGWGEGRKKTKKKETSMYLNTLKGKNTVAAINIYESKATDGRPNSALN